MEICPLGVGNSQMRKRSKLRGNGPWPPWPLDTDPKEGSSSFLSPMTLCLKPNSHLSPPAQPLLLQLFQGPIFSRQWPIQPDATSHGCPQVAQ